MLEPEPTKRFRFIYSAEHDPRTSGLKSGLNWVRKVRELDHGQSTMVGAINLYMSSELSYTWQEASMVVLKSQSQGPNHAQNIHTWIHHYLHHQKLPLHHYGTFSSSVLNDEDFAQEIQLHLLKVAKNGYVYAQDVVDYVLQTEVQESLSVKKRTISLKTAP